ncbi:hypothetical protein H6F61_24110 [Cyanobacteria bacterium FACHB-472]|nr:hypothetical protein [Cyanobacteria bacterium FACHB-472]
MHKDLELARFILEARWSQLIPAETSIERDPSGAIALRILKLGLRQDATCIFTARQTRKDCA